MTWLTFRSWMCDVCGKESWGAPPVTRLVGRHHRRHPESGLSGTVPTKYVHYCSEECTEVRDAAEVRSAMRSPDPGRFFTLAAGQTTKIRILGNAPPAYPHHTTKGKP